MASAREGLRDHVDIQTPADLEAHLHEYHGMTGFGRSELNMHWLHVTVHAKAEQSSVELTSALRHYDRAVRKALVRG